jgi:fructosamine-3-kinase
MGSAIAPGVRLGVDRFGMDAELRSEVASVLGSEIRHARVLSGGDINDVYELELASGAEVCLKTNAKAPLDMFPAEAAGLAWLSEATSIRVPTVLGVSGPNAKRNFLILEFIRPARRAADFDEQLGRSLAALHSASPEKFGLAMDNYIGPLAQKNSPRLTWAEFYQEQRLEPQFKMALKSGRLSPSLARSFEQLFLRLPELVGDAEPPARLHGDLWSGNVHVDKHGAPCLIDPAVYGGHREVDLAMMRLFGGFQERVFSAYEEDFPLAPGAAERVTLCQLYPLLVHVNLFGGSYAVSVERIVRSFI